MRKVKSWILESDEMFTEYLQFKNKSLLSSCSSAVVGQTHLSISGLFRENGAHRLCAVVDFRTFATQNLIAKLSERLCQSAPIEADQCENEKGRVERTRQQKNMRNLKILTITVNTSPNKKCFFPKKILMKRHVLYNFSRISGSI